MFRVRRRSPPRAVFLLILLLAPALLPVATANAARQAEIRQEIERRDHSGRAPAREIDTIGLGESRDAPLADPTGAPALPLAWDSVETHVGVPVLLAVRAVDDEGWRDSSQSGNATLFLDDLYAEVYAVNLGGERGVQPLAADAVGDSLLVDVPLRSGGAVLAVLFNSAGPWQAHAHLDGAPEIAGDSPRLIVHDVFFEIERPDTKVKQAE